MEEGRYWIALFNEGGETAGIQREVARYKRQDLARLKYQQWSAMYPRRLVMLCDRATILARSDRDQGEHTKAA